MHHATMRTRIVLLAVSMLVLAGISAPVGGAVTPPADQHADEPNPCVGTVTDEPENATLLSIQGVRGGEKTDGMLVGIAPEGSIIGVHNIADNGRWYAYDVDPMANGSLLFSVTDVGFSGVEVIDPTTGEHQAVHRFPEIGDSHDADLINGDELVINNMPRDGNDSVVVYNLTQGEVVWEYRFADHPEAFPKDLGGEFGGDWTHNNDIEQIAEGVFMVSVRNYDQVVAINRSTKEVVWRFGADDAYNILNEQHNPDYLRGENGRSTLLVADSLNDRVVEYARTEGGWDRTWVLRGGGLDEPRDADRLPSGNTLVVDRRGHRLIEVTPEGEVVWETYAPWQPYDAERVGTGDESAGPTMAELGTTGTHEMTGSRGVDESQTEACYEYLTSSDRDSQLLPADATFRANPPVADSAHLDPGSPADEPTETTAGGDEGPTDSTQATSESTHAEPGTADGGDDESSTETTTSPPLSFPTWLTVVALLAVIGRALLGRERG